MSKLQKIRENKIRQKVCEKILHRTCFLHLIFETGTLRHLIYTFFYTRGKPLVQKSANLMPSGTILKTVQKSPNYIFC